MADTASQSDYDEEDGEDGIGYMEGRALLGQSQDSYHGSYHRKYLLITCVVLVTMLGITGSIVASININVSSTSGMTNFAKGCGYVKTANHQYCQPGQDITDVTECILAASALGFPWTTAWNGPGDHRFCLFARQAVHFNTAGNLASPTPPNSSYASICYEATNQSASADEATNQSASADDATSLLCWVVMFPSEIELVKLQVKNGVSVFSCEEGLVISSSRESLGSLPNGLEVYPMPPRQPLNQSIMSPSLLDQKLCNTINFITAWQTVLMSGKAAMHEWIIKSDPDCVFFAGRLRPRLAPYVGLRVFFRNCQQWGGTLWGSLEIFSKKAIEAYKEQRDQCESLSWGDWGEDQYMGTCMAGVLQVQTIDDWNLVANAGCDPSWGNCADDSKVGFHPFKSPAQFETCLTQAGPWAPAPEWRPPVTTTTWTTSDRSDQ